jgi:4-amino-4-deoxy-L-arabinose transferase-like glycosyltransferase
MAAGAYCWGIGGVALETFYGGAARSMSESWHNFIFGAFDPWGTVSVDKLPGALWVQALSLRIFGFHIWAIVLPQVVEGTLTVLVLYRAVRRVAGPMAGLIAALVLAASPITVLLNRGNISDSLLILLLVLAADATTRAFISGRWQSLALAGVWVGLAFQAKMIQAWLVLPALYLAYVMAAPAATFIRRSAHVVLSVVIVGVVSLSWMTAVTLVPQHDRPYVDGSCNDSLFSQVFVYNGSSRFTGTELDQPGCTPPSSFLVSTLAIGRTLAIGTFSIHAGWDRLLKGPFGRDDAWVLIPSLVAAASALLRRRLPRSDPLRASTILWFSWLVITGAFFSTGQYLNSYYVAALMPAMAALCGIGAAVAWRARDRILTRLIVIVTVAASTIYGAGLIPAAAGVHTLVIASTVGVAGVAVLALLASLLPRHRSVWTISVGLALAAVALIMSSAWASGAVLDAGLGPFDTPYQPYSVTFVTQVLPAERRAAWPAIAKFSNGFPRNQAVDVFESSSQAGEDILATGDEYLPAGGFTGRVPSTTVPQFVRLVDKGRIPRALAALKPLSNNPVMRWVVVNCLRNTYGNDTTIVDLGTTFQRYLCQPADIDVGRSVPLAPRRGGRARLAVRRSRRLAP